MDSIIVCDTGADSLIKVNLSDYSMQYLPLDLGQNPIGPHSVFYQKGILISANNYNNSLSIVDTDNFKEKRTIYVGEHPNDIKILNDKAYVTCGDSNSLVEVDLPKGDIDLSIPVGEYPHTIEINKEKKIAYVSNMYSDSISVVDCVYNKNIGNIETGMYPVKIMLSNDKSMLYVCESYLGCDAEGYINIISTDTYSTMKKIKVGNGPVDMFEENNKLYVSNFESGSISVIDLKKCEEIGKLFIDGMPRGIVKFKNNIFVGDYLRGNIEVLDLQKGKIKTIAKGIEPNAMILI